jgi:hypothetical protein
VSFCLRYHEAVIYHSFATSPRAKDAENAKQIEFPWRAGLESLRTPAALQEPAADAAWRSRASSGWFPGHQERYRLPYPVRGTDRTAAASDARRKLTMRAFIAATGIALGLLAGWAALVPFVA